MTIRAVVFDCDGVFVDSEPAHFAAFRDSLSGVGIDLSEEDYYDRYIAYEDAAFFREVHADVREELTDERLQGLLTAKRTRLARSLPEMPLIEGSAGFLAGALLEGYRVAVASGARRDEVETVLDAAGVLEDVEVIVTAEDVRHHKPDPEPFLLALSRLNEQSPAQPLDAADCLVVEDAVIGICAAREAGMWVVGLTTTYSREALSGADLVLDTLDGITVAGISARLDVRGGEA